jgi:dipeptidyl aminopeptidase/acylaminoacyl peptidase
LPVETLPYLQWQASLEPRQLYSQSSPPLYPEYYKNQFYYLEQLAAEAGRCVLVRQQSDGTKKILTPDEFNMRSRVHEYGGKSFLLADDYIWFSNDADRRLYRQALTPLTLPEPLTTADSQDMAIDLQLTTDGKYLLFVQEKAVADDENENSLCALPLHADLPASPFTLVSGADFYANPVISPDGSQLAWIEWNHPQMPWDGSLLKLGALRDDQGSLSVEPSSIETIAGGVDCAVCQLQYSPAGRLFFALDGRDDERGLQSDCWDLFAWDGQSVVRITHDDGEYGEAHWIFGQQRYVVLDEQRVIAVRTRDGSDQLVEIDLLDSTISVLEDEHSTSLSQLSPTGQGAVVYAAASFSQAAAVHSCSIKNREISQWYSAEPLLDEADISVPQHLSYPTADGEYSHAWFYPPKNHLFQAPAGDKPPLLVMVHGGPTSRCDSALNYQRQYWTGRGFAVLDVNHRGSTGYCRNYRQSLQGKWGLIDSMDVADAVKYAIDQGLAHSQQVCIRGGSAGGYVVLRALTLFPDLFCAGACYYGIGNLVTLMEFTHKFEAHYLDGLLGGPYHGTASDRPGSPYYDRSPLHDLALLKSPMIVFQGLEDKVVPPELSRELIESLQQRGIYHQYIEYPDEGHGFKNLGTRIDALEKEAAFFCGVIDGDVK